MTIERAREILGPKAESIPEDELQGLVDVIGTVCSIMIEDKLSNK